MAIPTRIKYDEKQTQTKLHRVKKPIVNKTPVSGSEPTATKEPFGTALGIRSNNCTAYSYQQYSTEPGFKLQPGNLAGLYSDFSLKTCSPGTRRVLADLQQAKLGYQAEPDDRCKTGYSKIMLLLAPDADYHFIRQNGDVMYDVQPGQTLQSIAQLFRVPKKRVILSANGKTARVVKANVWSHKRGTAFGPELWDAKGQLIMDPRKSSFDYGDYNYRKYCSSFCIKQKPCNKTKNNNKNKNKKNKNNNKNKKKNNNNNTKNNTKNNNNNKKP